METVQMTGLGLELPANLPGKTHIPQNSGALSGARVKLSTSEPPAKDDDADALGDWLNTCPKPLTPELRQAVRRMIESPHPEGTPAPGRGTEAINGTGGEG